MISKKVLRRALLSIARLYGLVDDVQCYDILVHYFPELTYAELRSLLEERVHVASYQFRVCVHTFKGERLLLYAQWRRDIDDVVEDYETRPPFDPFIREKEQFFGFADSHYAPNIKDFEAVTEFMSHRFDKKKRRPFDFTHYLIQMTADGYWRTAFYVLCRGNFTKKPLSRGERGKLMDLFQPMVNNFPVAYLYGHSPNEWAKRHRQTRYRLVRIDPDYLFSQGESEVYRDQENMFKELFESEEMKAFLAMIQSKIEDTTPKA